MAAHLRSISSATSLVVALLSASPSFAAEEGKSVYLLGSTASMAGATPPPGMYFSSLGYFYSGEASGSAAISRVLSQSGIVLPSPTVLDINADVSVDAQVALDVLSLLWVPQGKVLGGNIGFGALLPVGSQEVDVDVNAVSTLTFPNGTTLQRGRSFSLSDDTFAFGDPLATAFIGWTSGNWHWKAVGLVNIPIGDYDQHDLVNMGFNRWAGDLTGAATWLDPQSGLELSAAAGFTINGENPDTNYKTGTEFHLEGAIMQHLSQAVAIGVAGYHYQQVTGDSGSGAVFGDFKGEVSAIGSNLNYNFQVDGVPVFTSARWLHEFEAENRLEGDAGFLSVTIPLGGADVQ